MRKKNQNLFNGRQQDAHEFLVELLESMDGPHHSTHPMGSFFEGMVTSTVTCLECKRESPTSTCFKSLEIEITSKNHINDAFNHYFASEHIKRYDCDNCKKDCDAKKQLKITKPPICLFVQLKRFTVHGKINNAVEFDQILNLSQYYNDEAKYKLIAVINHIGEGRESGHYTTVARTENDSFYEFDDIRVKPISLSRRNKYVYILLFELLNQPVPNESTGNKPKDYGNKKVAFDFIYFTTEKIIIFRRSKVFFPKVEQISLFHSAYNCINLNSI